MRVLLVGVEVPLADDADLVAPDVDELNNDLVVDVWLVVEVSDLVMVVLVSDEEIEEEVSDEELEEEAVELDVVVVKVDGEGLVD